MASAVTGSSAESAPNDSAATRSPPLLLGVLFLLGCSFLNLVFFGTARSADSAPIVGFLAGMIVAELGLLAIWCVFSTWPFYLRWPLGLVVLVWLFFALLLGLALAEPANWRSILLRQLANLVFLLPLVWLTLQIPLWAARFWSGKRLEGEHDARAATESLRIQHLFLGTVVVAVCLGLARAVGETQVDFWGVVAIVCLCFLAGGTLTLPAVWIIFHSSRRAVAAGAVLLYACLVGAVLATVLGAISQGMPASAAASIISFVVGIGLMLLLGLLALRGIGYRLKRADEI